MRVSRAILAGSLSAAITAVLFLFFGALLPVWTMMAVHGRQAVQDAPAHGGMIILATLPLAGLVSIPFFLFLTSKLYRKLNHT